MFKIYIHHLEKPPTTWLWFTADPEFIKRIKKLVKYERIEKSSI